MFCPANSRLGLPEMLGAPQDLKDLSVIWKLFFWKGHLPWVRSQDGERNRPNRQRTNCREHAG